MSVHGVLAGPSLQPGTSVSKGWVFTMTHTTLDQTSRLQPIENRFLPRKGALGWWLNLTAPPRPADNAPIQEKERVRKAELTSYSILAIFVLVVGLVSNSLADPASAESVGGMGFFLVIAAVLNRTGHTRTAAYLLPSLFMALDVAAIVHSTSANTTPAGQLTLLLLPAYDLLAIPIFLSSLTANQKAPWVFGVIAGLFIVLDYNIQPHASVLMYGHSVNELAFWTPTAGGDWAMINRHLFIALFAAFFGWLGARSVENAITHADRSDEIIALTKQIAQEQHDTAETIDAFLEEILDAFRAQANGENRQLSLRPPKGKFDFNRRIHLVNGRLRWFARRQQDQDFWMQGPVGQAALNLAVRLEKVRKGEVSLDVGLAPQTTGARAEVIDKIEHEIHLLLNKMAQSSRAGTETRRGPAHIQPFRRSSTGPFGS